MRSCAILSSISEPFTSCTAVFIAGPPAAALRVSLFVMRGARNLSLRRVFWRRSKRQSVMEGPAKAKLGAGHLSRVLRAWLVSRPLRCGGDSVFGRLSTREVERSGTCRNNSACVLPRSYRVPLGVGGANRYRRRGDYLKEISKE